MTNVRSYLGNLIELADLPDVCDTTNGSWFFEILSELL